MTELIDAIDADYIWMLGGEPRLAGLRLPPGGVDQPAILNVVRAIAKKVRASHDRGAWMIVADGEVVGLCGYKSPPDKTGEVEIGYGVAASRRNLGHATRAVTGMVEAAIADPAVKRVIALTAIDNLRSQGCLVRNGFVEEGRQVDPEDGEVIRWARDLSPS